MKPFAKLKHEDENTQRLSDACATKFLEIDSKKILDGNLIADVALSSSGPNRVLHRLGRLPVSWIVCSRSADSQVWQASKDSDALTLECSSSVTVTLWVF